VFVNKVGSGFLFFFQVGKRSGGIVESVSCGASASTVPAGQGYPLYLVSPYTILQV